MEPQLSLSCREAVVGNLPSSKNARWPEWMNQKRLDKVKHKKEATRRWKKGQAAWEEY